VRTVIADAVFAYLHYAAILTLASALGAEALLLRAHPGAATLRALARADALYGITAGAVLATGLLRLFLGAKAVEFYATNPVFWAKMALFALIALMSIPATVRIFGWRRALRSDPGFIPSAAEVQATRRLVFVESHVLALVPLAAVFMARGLG
jgi:putative membrane protein